MANKENNDLLIQKFLSGQATEEEEKSLIRFLGENQDNRLKYFNTKRIWLASRDRQDDAEFVDNSWKRLNIRMEGQESKEKSTEKPKKHITWRKLAVAATISILVVTSAILGVLNFRASQYASTEHQITVPYGSRSSIVLPDGSKVWINSGSTLTYGSNFGKNREVELTGEAYFDVIHLNNKSFTVNTSDLRILVLGTEFNVKSYPEDDIIETTLVNGKVKIEPVSNEESATNTILAPNQKFIYTKKDQRSQPDPVVDNELTTNKEDILQTENEVIQIIRTARPEEESAWKDGRLIIRSEPLGSLAKELERYYDVQISFGNDSIKDFRYSGTLEEITIEEVLLALASSSPIKYEINKKNVMLTLSRSD